jgi:hypothetical protein
MNGAGIRVRLHRGRVWHRPALQFANDFHPPRPTSEFRRSCRLLPPPGGPVGETILPFVRTLAPLSNRAIAQLSHRGDILPSNLTPSRASLHQGVMNSADQGPGVAPGGLISITG